MGSLTAHFAGQGRLATCPRAGVATGGPIGPVIEGKIGRIEVPKSVISTRTHVAKQAPSAHASTAVLPAEVLRDFAPATNASSLLLKLPSFLNVHYWAATLPLVFSEEKATGLLKGLTQGVRIGRPPAVGVIESPNWPSANQFARQVSDVVAHDLAHGRLYGPFAQPPFANYVISPLGAFLKRDKVKARVIHDLSYPHANSVNSGIDPDAYSLHYASVDNAVEACNRRAFPFIANIDLKDAYKFIGVHPDDWHLLGFTWALPDSGSKYYFSRVLSFGLRSAPAIFDDYASALEQFMVFGGVDSNIVRYVDDFLVISDSRAIAADHVSLMVKIARLAGFVIQDSKVAGPCRVLEFLGIIIDLDANVLRISEERVAEIKSLLTEWSGPRSASKRNLLRLIGKLAFAARVVRTGRAFLGRLIGLAKSAKALHHHVRLSQAARADVDWWRKCIDSHNGVTTMVVDWFSGVIHHVYTDASNHGMGAVFNDQWFALSYTGAMAFAAEHSINWRELHVAVKAMATWASCFAGAKVKFHVDNSSAVFILNKLYTPEAGLMELVRQWCLLLEQHAITVGVEYIATGDNTRADLLSRGEIERFTRDHCPSSGRIWPASFPYFDKQV